jgi:hypothetical protein
MQSRTMNIRSMHGMVAPLRAIHVAVTHIMGMLVMVRHDREMHAMVSYVSIRRVRAIK